MAELLPPPGRANGSSSGPLDPTRVIPGPQPLDPAAAGRARIISGEVVGGYGQRRGAHARRPRRGTLGRAVLSATGAVAGLSMLMAHDSSGASAERHAEPATSSPEQAVAGEPMGSSLAAASVSAPLTATGQPPRTPLTTVPDAPASAAASSGTSTAAGGAPSSGGRGETAGSWNRNAFVQTAPDQQAVPDQQTASDRQTAQRQAAGRPGGGDSEHERGRYGGGYGHG